MTNRRHKRNIALFILFYFTIILSAKGEDPSWVKEVGAANLNFGSSEYRVRDFGAAADGKKVCTQEIQKTIDKCAADGGGRVIFEKGVYLTGSLFIKSGVLLTIDEETELRGSQDLKDYPEIDTRVAGIEMKWPAALVNIIGQSNAGIEGNGVINGQGKPFWDAYRALREEYEPKKLRWIVDYDAKRPRALLISNSANVAIRGVTFQQSGFWTVHILYSSKITVDGVIIRNNIGGSGPSTDGIDIDSSEKILVQNCDIDCNDDNFCIKSGRDWDGLRVNRAAEYILIRDCISRQGGGLITFGSETSGGMRHIIARNLKAHGTKTGIRFKSAKNRGGTVEDITIENIHMSEVGTVIEITPNWNPAYSYSELPTEYNPEAVPEHWKKMLHPVDPGKGVPVFKDIIITDIYVDNAAKAIFADGLPEKPLKNFLISNVRIDALTAGLVRNAENWRFVNINIATRDQSKPEIINSKNITM